MLNSLINKFGSTLYIQIWENRIRAVDIKTSAVFDEKPLLQVDTNKKRVVTAFGNSAFINPINPFSHPRSLLNDFHNAECLLQAIVKKLAGKKLISPAPEIIIHPMEKIEGGLTSIEIRAFTEMAYGAGAREVAIYQGKETLVISQIDFKQIVKQSMEES